MKRATASAIHSLSFVEIFFAWFSLIACHLPFFSFFFSLLSLRGFDDSTCRIVLRRRRIRRRKVRSTPRSSRRRGSEDSGGPVTRSLDILLLSSACRRSYTRRGWSSGRGSGGRRTWIAVGS